LFWTDVLARAENTGSARSHLEAALNAQTKKEYSKAAEEYEAALKIGPGSPEIYQNLGLVRHMQNQYTGAIQAFEKALTLNPQMWASNLFLGIAYYKTNQFSRAATALSKALELNPAGSELEGRFWLGITYKALGRPQDAAIELEKRLERSPQDIEVLYQLSDAYRLFAPDKASEVLQRVMAVDPASYRVAQMEGEAFEREEKYTQALEAYRRAYQLKPDLPGLRFALGSVYWKTRQFEEAEKWLLKVLEEQPDNALASRALQQVKAQE